MPWPGAGTLTTARAYHTATLLPNGQVLAAGGRGTQGALNSTEIYLRPGRRRLEGRFGPPAACYQHTAALWATVKCCWPVA